MLEKKGVRVMKKRKYRDNTVFLRFIAILSAIAAVFALSFFRMRPIVISYAVSVAETKLINAANEAVLQILNEENVTYSDIITLSRDSDGNVTSAETDIAEINSLKSLISLRLSDIIDSREYYDLYIPLGTFFSNSYTNAVGPKVRFKMQLTATAVTDFSHEFKSAGINQVLHLVMIDVDIGGSFVAAWYKKPIKVSTSVIAAQTVIVGKTPEAFTQVIENEGDETAGLINDYGAVPAE